MYLNVKLEVCKHGNGGILLINKSTIQIKSNFGHEINNLFLSHTPKSKSIVILFPGGEGNCDKPLLHYARKATLLSGCDVLSLEYGYYRTNKDYNEEFFNQTVEEVKEAIHKCACRSYENIYFISKSLGTIIAGEISKAIGYDKVSNLFLTPTMNAISYITNSKCTVVIGTKDKVFPKEYIEKVSNLPSVNLKVINDATHSLEIEDNYIKSLEILVDVAKLCESFVCSENK